MPSSGAGDAFNPPEGFDPAAWVVRDPWDAGDEAMVATVVFDPDVAWIARRELGTRATGVEQPDGSFVAEIQVAAPGACLGWIVGFEDRAEILAPAPLREQFLRLVNAP